MEETGPFKVLNWKIWKSKRLAKDTGTRIYDRENLYQVSKDAIRTTPLIKFRLPVRKLCFRLLSRNGALEFSDMLITLLVFYPIKTIRCLSEVTTNLWFLIASSTAFSKHGKRITLFYSIFAAEYSWFFWRAVGNSARCDWTAWNSALRERKIQHNISGVNSNETYQILYGELRSCKAAAALYGLLGYSYSRFVLVKVCNDFEQRT